MTPHVRKINGLGFLISLCGLLLNFFAFDSARFQTRQTASTWWMRFLAIWENVSLTTSGILGLGLRTLGAELITLNDFTCKLMTFQLFAGGLNASSHMVCLAVDRAFATTFPIWHRGKEWRKIVRNLSICLTLFHYILALPKLYLYELQDGLCASNGSSVMSQLYEVTLVIVFFSLGHFVPLLVSNLVFVRNLWNRSKNKAKSKMKEQSSDRMENKTKDKTEKRRESNTLRDNQTDNNTSNCKNRYHTDDKNNKNDNNINNNNKTIPINEAAPTSTNCRISTENSCPVIAADISASIQIGCHKANANNNKELPVNSSEDNETPSEGDCDQGKSFKHKSDGSGKGIDCTNVNSNNLGGSIRTRGRRSSASATSDFGSSWKLVSAVSHHSPPMLFSKNCP